MPKKKDKKKKPKHRYYHCLPYKKVVAVDEEGWGIFNSKDEMIATSKSESMAKRIATLLYVDDITEYS